MNILKYFGYISNDDMLTVLSETCRVLEKDFKQDKDRLINLINDKDSKIDRLESDFKMCVKHVEQLSGELINCNSIIENLRETNNRFNAKANSAIKSRDTWKDKYNKLVGKIALQNATHK